MIASIPFRYLGCVLSLFLLCGGCAFSQTIDSSQTDTTASDTYSDSPLLLQFEQTQLSLRQDMAQLVAQGATSEQLTLWTNQNQAVFQAQQSLAIQLGALSAAQPLPLITDVTIPAGASQDLDDFLTIRASLINSFAQIHNQLVAQGIVSPTQESASFEQQNSAVLQAQDQRIARLTAVAAQQPLPVPPPLVLPPNASPALQAFLTARYQLMSDRVVIWNQNLSATPAAREATLQEWDQQNASQIQQMQQLAQNLSNTTTSSNQ